MISSMFSVSGLRHFLLTMLKDIPDDGTCFLLIMLANVGNYLVDGTCFLLIMLANVGNYLVDGTCFLLIMLVNVGNYLVDGSAFRSSAALSSN